jgi:iron complex outermembrane recepter protein
MYQLQFLSHLGMAVVAVTLAVQSAEARPQQPLVAQNATPKEIQGSGIRKVRELPRPATTVKEWLAQTETQPAVIPVPITAVNVERTATGLTIILETQDGKPLAVDASQFRTEGKTLIADIPNAVLALPQATEFQNTDPAVLGTEIGSASVTQLDAATVRVSVTGKGALPKGDITLRAAGLAYSLKPDVDTPDEEVVVTGERQNRYRPPTASTGTRLEVPLRDLPLSIQVIPREVIEDRGVFRLDELADNVSGVQAERGYGGLSSQGYRIRGFITNFETLRNGFPDYGYFSPRDVANVERVEFLKGPAAVLYGGSPTQYYGGSGVVNTVTKKPLDEPY